MSSNHQLGLARMILAKHVVEICQDAIVVKMASHVRANDVLHQLANGTCQRHRPVVFRLAAWTFLVHW